MDVEITSGDLTESQLKIVEDEFSKFLDEMKAEELDRIRRLHEDYAFRFVTGLPIPLKHAPLP